ncbi:MAG: hypothetical protein ACXVCF_09065, partial [Isosphaeraceae bacterium]
HRRWRELRDLVDRLLYDKLGTLFHYQQQGKVRVFDVPLDGWGLVRIPGEARVEELLDLVVAAEHANCGQELGMLRKRHAKIVASFPEATPGIRKALAQEAVKLEAEIERLSVGLGSLGGELRAVFKDISALAYEVSRAQRMLVDSDHQAMAEAVRSVLERIDCEFEVISYPSGYEFTRLKGVRITPRLGNPEYRGVPQNGIPLRRCR